MNIPINHVLLIPAMLGIGFYLGWRVGSSSMLRQWQRAEEKRKKREDAE